MTLTQLVHAAVVDCLKADFTPETRVGQANRADFTGSNSEGHGIRVELERRREDPVNNVVKAWRQACSSPNEPAFTLVHVFSGFYATRRAKRDNAVFVGHMMANWARQSGRALNYIDVSFDFEPPAGDADPTLSEDDAQRIRQQIHEQLEKHASE